MLINDHGITFDLNKKVFVIAELSGNHRHDFDIVVESIKAAKAAGADAVKSQLYTPDTITLDVKNKYFTIKQDSIWDNRTFYDLYREAYTPWEWMAKIQQLCHELGLIFFASAFDHTAVDFLEDLNVPLHKIASPEITDIPLIRYAASKRRPLILSTGIAEKKDIQLALKTCSQENPDQIILLKCTTAYPTPLEEVNLLTMVDMKKRFHTEIGLSDHTIGDTVPVAAVALGARVIEKHFILDRKIGGPDASFSMEPAEFKQMVDSVRDVELAMGKVSYALTKHQLKSRQGARSIFISKDIPQGGAINSENIQSIRPSFGLHPRHWDNVIGKTVKRALKRGQPLRLIDLQ